MTTYCVKICDNGEFTHSIGGTTNAKCPVCGKDVVVLLRYDNNDNKTSKIRKNIKSVPLVFCFVCDLWEMTYKLKDDGLVVLGGDGIKDEYICAKMQSNRVEFIEIPKNICYNSSEFGIWYNQNYGSQAPQPFPHIGDPVGIINGYTPGKCQECSERLDFFSALYDTPQIKFDLGGNMAQIVFSVCKKCSIINAKIHQN